MTNNNELRALLRQSSGEFISALTANFPALKRKAEFWFPGRASLKLWEALRFRALGIGASHGERCAVQFVLSVWNPATDWDDSELLKEWIAETGVTEASLGWDPLQTKIGKFDVFDALGVWETGDREAFLEWAKSPIWP